MRQESSESPSRESRRSGSGRTFACLTPIEGFLGVVSAAMIAAPLFPGLTPGWPGSWTLPPLLASLLVLLPVVHLVRTRGPASLTPRTMVLAAILPLYAIYTGNGISSVSGDNLGTRVLPSHFLRTGSFDLTGVPPFDRGDLPYCVTRVGSRVLNAYPSGTAIVAIPYAVFGLAASGGEVSGELVSRWDKHSSALLMIAAAGLLFASARRFGTRGAAGAAAVFALATPIPTGPAQSLWSFTGEIFCLTLALFALLGVRARPILAGVALGGAFACRPTALIPAAVLLVATAFWRRRTAARAFLAAALTAGAVALWQARLYGHPLGAYGISQTARLTWPPSWPAAFGVLLSPSRGLLVFFPYVLLLPLAGVRVIRARNAELGTWWVASAALVGTALLLAASHAHWWGGWGLGPRLMSECAPFLALATVPLWTSDGWGRRSMIALFTFSAVTQLLLAYNPDASRWNELVHARMRNRSLSGLRESQLLAAWIPGWLDRNFGLREPRSFDRAESSELTGWIESAERDRNDPSNLRVQGWGRIPGEDLEAVFLLDGSVVRPRVLRRVSRADVAAAVPALGGCDSCGFDATLPLLSPGAAPDLLVVLRARDGRIRRFEGRRLP